MIKITKEILRRWFEEINRNYFNDELITPKNFVISNNKSRYGQFRPASWEIEISTAYVRSERDYYNTFLHEICHLYVSQNYKGRVRSHGVEWKSIAARITKLTKGEYGTIQRVGGSQDKCELRSVKKSKFVVFIDYNHKLSIGKYNDEKYVEKLMKFKAVAPGSKVYRLESDDAELCNYRTRSANSRHIYWNYVPVKWKLEDILAKCTLVNVCRYHQCERA